MSDNVDCGETNGLLHEVLRRVDEIDATTKHFMSQTTLILQHSRQPYEIPELNFRSDQPVRDSANTSLSSSSEDARLRCADHETSCMSYAFQKHFERIINSIPCDSIHDRVVESSLVTSIESINFSKLPDDRNKVRIIVVNIMHKHIGAMRTLLELIGEYDSSVKESVENTYSSALVEDSVHDVDKNKCTACYIKTRIHTKDISESLFSQGVISKRLYKTIANANTELMETDPLWERIYEALSRLPLGFEADALERAFSDDEGINSHADIVQRVKRNLARNRRSCRCRCVHDNNTDSTLNVTVGSYSSLSEDVDSLPSGISADDIHIAVCTAPTMSNDSYGQHLQLFELMPSHPAPPSPSLKLRDSLRKRNPDRKGTTSQPNQIDRASNPRAKSYMPLNHELDSISDDVSSDDSDKTICSTLAESTESYGQDLHSTEQMQRYPITSTPSLKPKRTQKRNQGRKGTTTQVFPKSDQADKQHAMMGARPKTKPTHCPPLQTLSVDTHRKLMPIHKERLQQDKATQAPEDAFNEPPIAVKVAHLKENEHTHVINEPMKGSNIVGHHVTDIALPSGFDEEQIQQENGDHGYSIPTSTLMSESTSSSALQIKPAGLNSRTRSTDDSTKPANVPTQPLHLTSQTSDTNLLQQDSVSTGHVVNSNAGHTDQDEDPTNMLYPRNVSSLIDHFNKLVLSGQSQVTLV